jgi:hypothetical protein
MMSESMADLEKLAVQRDRGYLVRLILGLLVGGLVSVFVFRGLTGETTTGCVAGLLGAEPSDQPPSAAP